MLSAGAAFAAEPGAAATSAPTASATPASATPASAASAAGASSAGTAATSTPTATPTSPATPTATPKPTAAAKAVAPKAAPTDLKAATVPAADRDGYVRVTGTRDITITGTAPIGAKVVVTDSWGEPIKRLTTTATSFSIPLHFADDAGYEQYLSVYATYRGEDLSEYDFDVEFDAEQSATPTITDPTAAVSYEASPFPFSNGEPLAVVQFSGTGTPGSDVYLVAQTSDEESGGDIFTFDFNDSVSVGDDGTWTSDHTVSFGTEKVSAYQVVTNDEGDEITRESELSNTIGLTITVPAGTVVPPTVLKPTYDDSSFGSLGFSFSSSNTAAASSAAEPARTQAQKVKARAARAEDPSLSSSSSSRASVLPRAVQALADEADETDAEIEKSLDEIIDELGIPVKGTASAATPGKLAMKVSGTGTPGQHVVLYEERPLTSLYYFEALYPTLFSGEFEPEVLNADSATGAARLSSPSALSGDPASTTPLPVDDGSIVVAADGTWSTTLARTPGNYIMTAFQVDPAATGDAAYSVPSDIRFIHLTGTPFVTSAAVAGAAPAELAFTGSDSGPQALVGFAVLGLGVGLLVVARRRRGSASA